MKASDLTDSDLTKWAAEKFCIGTGNLPVLPVMHHKFNCPGCGADLRYLPELQVPVFDPIHDANHRDMIIGSERFPEALHIKLFHYNQFLIKNDDTKYETIGPLNQLGRKLLEVLWEMMKP